MKFQSIFTLKTVQYTLGRILNLNTGSIFLAFRINMMKSKENLSFKLTTNQSAIKKEHFERIIRIKEK